MLIIYFGINTCVEKIPTEYLVVEVPVGLLQVPVHRPLLRLQARLGQVKLSLA